MEMIANPLSENVKIVLTEHGISPTLLLDSLPVNVATDAKARTDVFKIEESRASMKGMIMEDQLVCPNCGKPLPNNSMIEDAIQGKGSDAQSMYCECGERITYWNVTAQLREQKTFGYRFQHWFRSLTHSRAL